MPYRKKSNVMRPKKGRRMVKRYRKYRRSRVPRSFAAPSGIFHGRERFCLGLYTPANNVTDLNQALTFNIDQVQNFVHLTGMYDMFRINKVVCTFRPVCTEVSFANAFAYPGKLLVVRDYDDNTALTSQDQYYQYRDCKMIPLASGRKLSIGITPATLSAMYQSGVATAYSPKYKQWIDNANSPTPHYGIKFGMIRNGATGSQAAWPATPPSVEVFVTMYYSCKGQR